MARELGNRLPDLVCELLSGRDLSARMGEAILITTADAEGWPHPALLSYGEMVAVDRHRTSRTSGNLRRNGKLTVCLIGPNMAYYIKAAAGTWQDPMQEFPHLARFEAGIESVLADQAREDVEPGTCITGGIRFDPGRPREVALQGWQAVVDGLRREA
jgi:hypothetical protein